MKARRARFILSSHALDDNAIELSFRCRPPPVFAARIAANSARALVLLTTSVTYQYV